MLVRPEPVWRRSYRDILNSCCATLAASAGRAIACRLDPCRHVRQLTWTWGDKCDVDEQNMCGLVACGRLEILHSSGNGGVSRMKWAAWRSARYAKCRQCFSSCSCSAPFTCPSGPQCTSTHALTEHTSWIMSQYIADVLGLSATLRKSWRACVITTNAPATQYSVWTTLPMQTRIAKSDPKSQNKRFV